MTQPSFTHPLARHAKVWTACNDVGTSKDVLVIVTTLVLEADDERFKADKMAKLSDAARAWIAQTDDADDFVLVNRHRDWE